MMNCSEMKSGEVYVCKDCGLEIQVVKPCTCGTAGHSGEACTMPMQCCGGDLKKK